MKFTNVWHFATFALSFSFNFFSNVFENTLQTLRHFTPLYSMKSLLNNHNTMIAPMKSNWYILYNTELIFTFWELAQKNSRPKRNDDIFVWATKTQKEKQCWDLWSDTIVNHNSSYGKPDFKFKENSIWCNFLRYTYYAHSPCPTQVPGLRKSTINQVCDSF